MKYIASISGGKDSVAMCLRLVEEHRHVDAFVFADTGMEYPECYDAIHRFEELTGREVTVLRREGWSFEWAMIDKSVRHHNIEKPRRDGLPRREKGYGWPSYFKRWCTKELKTKVLTQFSKRQGDYIEFVGIASDEPKRVRLDPKKRYPLVEWGMTESDCLSYCRDRGFYKSPCAYDHCSRMSCYCCPLSNLKQIRYLVTKRPVLWSEIKRLEERLGEPWKRGIKCYEAKFLQKELFSDVGLADDQRRNDLDFRHLNEFCKKKNKLC